MVFDSGLSLLRIGWISEVLGFARLRLITLILHIEFLDPR